MMTRTMMRTPARSTTLPPPYDASGGAGSTVRHSRVNDSGYGIVNHDLKLENITMTDTTDNSVPTKTPNILK